MEFSFVFSLNLLKEFFKSQFPNPNDQSNPKPQTLIMFGHLSIGHSLGIGHWGLVIFHLLTFHYFYDLIC